MQEHAPNVHGNPISRRVDQVDPPVDPEAVDLTVVFITRNEESRIGECIQSTMSAAEEAKRLGVLRTVEYVLVDSASTDRTLEIASRFPVSIVRLSPSWPLSAGAGTYAGVLHARGVLVAVINGDMTIDPRWFVEALPRIEGRIAAVTGIAKEALRGHTPIERLVIRYSASPLSEGVIPPEVSSHPGGFSTGTLLVSTAAARAVGSVNPFLRAAEDHDLRHRLLRGGWEVLDLPIVQGTHYWTAEEADLDLLSYFKTMQRNAVGLGQMARIHWRRDPSLARLAIRPIVSGRVLFNGLLGLFGVVLASLHVIGFFVWVPALAMGLAGDIGIVLRAWDSGRRSGTGLVDSLFADWLYPVAYTLVRTVGFVRGFLAKPRGPQTYPRPPPPSIPPR